MTDEVVESNFSFRLFDLYRRFVEVLQLYPNYLQEFKTGAPKQEVCQDIIKKVFHRNQSIIRIEHLSKYLIKNSKVIAAHAENIPCNWKDAIRYTDTCIKFIRKYLKKKGINVKTVLDSVQELAMEVGQVLHNNPNEKQIEAIREYLKYDLENPKKTITSPTSKKSKNKTSIIGKSPNKIENTGVPEVQKNNLKMIIRRLSNDRSQIQTEKSFNDKSLPIGDELSSNNEQSLMESEKEFCENSLQNENELKEKSSTKDKKEEYNSYLQGEEIPSDKLYDPEFIKSLLRDSIKSCSVEDYLIMEIDEKSQNGISEENEEQFENSSPNKTIFSNNSRRKRSSISIEDDTYCIKKLFLPDAENNQYVTISYCNANNEEYEYKMVPFLDTNDKSCETTYDNSDSEIIIVDDDDDQEVDNKNLSNKSINNEQIDEGKKGNALDECKNEFIVEQDGIAGTETKYSEVQNMSYSEALKLVETIMAFCELRNEISLEEFLVLRRTRDKMEWRSLKEAKK